MLLEVAGNVAEQRDIRVVVGDRAQRKRVSQPGHPDVEPGIRVDREEVAAEPRVTDPLGEGRLEDVPVDQVFVRKPLAGDLEQPIPESANRYGPPLDVRLGHGPESRRGNAVERGRETGLLLAAELHEVVKEELERSVAGLRRQRRGNEAGHAEPEADSEGRSAGGHGHHDADATETPSGRETAKGASRRRAPASCE